MSRTPAPTIAEQSVAAVEPFGLDEPATLEFVVEQRRRQDQAAAQELRAVAHWADLHRTGDGSGELVGAVDRTVASHLVARPVLGREGELRLLHQGAFSIEEFALCQLAAALRMSETAARTYVGQALELRERLPGCWTQVMAGVLPAWKARQIATETIPLNAAAAAYVDAHLAPFAARMSLGRVLRAVHAAAVRHDHQLADDRARKAMEGRGVWVNDDLDGTSTITAVASTPDAAAFEHAVHGVATDLAALGSTAPEQVRRAAAIGVLGDPQYALDLHATAEGMSRTTANESQAPTPAAKLRKAPVLHLHLHTDALAIPADPNEPGHVGRVEGVGARSMEAVRQWIAGLAPGAQLTLTPVVDLNQCISVDAYEVPDRLRAQVDHRDQGCRFPWCGRRGRFDADHIEPYVPPDEGGPPGQTNSTNIARLCRFHHRVKTHTDWDYQRHPDGTLLWTSPLGHTYAVDEHGTFPRR